MIIGVIGNGFVGKATRIFARTPSVKCLVFDVDPSKCDPPGLTCERLATECDLVFVCVPTPMNAQHGYCDTSIVAGCVKQLKAANSDVDIVVRSTVPPGTCQKLGVAHMPEYLTEANWELDFIGSSEWHLGLPDGDSALSVRDKFARLLNECHSHAVIASDTLIVKSSNVTEAAKYFRNAMLAVKVAVCNEFEQYCRAADIDYKEVRSLLVADPRIGASHTAVPGPDGRRGFGGTCLPKDLSGLIHSMLEVNVLPTVLNSAKTRNETVDRPECDWLKDIGRAVAKDI